MHPFPKNFRSRRKRRLLGLKFTVKAIFTASKVANGIAIIILFLFFLSVFGPLSASTSAIACIGGIVVFWGLWIEKDAEKIEHEDISKFAKSLRLAKLKSESGWWILMFGIAIEIGDAGWTSWEIWEAKQVANPLNQPISTIKANVFLLVNGTNKSQATFLGEPNSSHIPLIKLLVGKSAEMESGWSAALACSSIDYSVMYATNSALHAMGTAWALDFGGERLGGNILSFISEKLRVKDALDWDMIEVDMSNLPSGCEIWGGHIKLIVNSTVLTFKIAPQTARMGDLMNLAASPRNGALHKPVTNFVTVVCF